MLARDAKITATAYSADGTKICSSSTIVSFYKFNWQKSQVASMNVKNVSNAPIWYKNIYYVFESFFVIIKMCL